MHKIVHFAMLQTTKYCSRIQVKSQDAFYHASNRTPQMVGFAQIVQVNCPSSR